MQIVSKILYQLIKRDIHWNVNEKLYHVFVDLEKAFDQVPRKAIECMGTERGEDKKCQKDSWLQSCFCMQNQDQG